MKKIASTDDPPNKPDSQNSFATEGDEKSADCIENAHSTGDGAVGKHSDALLASQDEENEAMYDEMKKEAERY